MTSASEDRLPSFKRYVDLMYKAMDRDVDPTKDFIKYARGNFRRENYDVTKGDYLPVFRDGSYENIILNEAITYPSLKKARDYRKSHVKDFKSILRNKQLHEICGTFPAFDEYWKSENFDWIKATAILSAMHFRIILSYKLEYLNGKESVVLSVIGPEETPISSASEVLEEIGITGDKSVDILSDVKIIFEKIENIEPPIGYPKFEKVPKTFKELKEEQFDYPKFLKTLSEEPISDNDIIYLNNLEPGHFEKFLNIFEEVGPKVVANYITYKVAYQLNHNYYSTAVTLYHFTPVVISAGFSVFWKEDTNRRRKEVFQIFTNSLTKVKDNFKHDVTRELNFHTFNDTEIKIFIDLNFNQTEIEKDYENLEIDTENFFQNFLNIRKHGKTSSTKRYILLNRNNEDLFGKALQLLTFLIHAENKPLFFYFSGWEMYIWNDIISQCAFDRNCDEYKSFQNIINKHIDKYKLPRGVINDNFWVNHGISTVAALKMAFEDYMTWICQNEADARVEEEALRRFNLTSSQAFFVSYVQHHCLEEGIILNSVILSLLNSEYFAQTFKCKFDSDMNPKEKIIINFNKV